MTKKQLIETIRRVIKETLEEAAAPATAPSKPQEEPEVEERPTTPPSKPEPRRTVGNPGKVKDPGEQPFIGPKAKGKKATMTEAEMLAKIVKRFKQAKKNG
jgi:hypothetical protein